MKKIKLLMPVALSLATVTPILPLTTSCNKDKTKTLKQMLESMPRVVKVEKLDKKYSYNDRYMVYFKHPLDWNDESKGTFIQRAEFDFRGLDRVNQLFTCGYELRQEKPNRMNDYEIATHFQGNIIKPEYRFYDQSRPEGLSNDKTELWQYLDNTQAAKDFHSMITAFKTILTGKWAFTGTSKGGETTNFYAMNYPNDCAAYVPYVAPIFYEPGGAVARQFQENVYGQIGYDVLGENIAKEYHNEIAQFQYYALCNRNVTIPSKGNKTLCDYFWGFFNFDNFRQFVKDNKEIVFDMCVCECGTAFWQYNQNISQLKDFNMMADGEEKLIACCDIIRDLNDPTGWQTDSLFFPYYVQAKREMGEYTYDFIEMVNSIVSELGISKSEVDSKLAAQTQEQRQNLLWKCCFTDEQRTAWANFDDTSSKKLKSWWHTCESNVFMIYGGADTWTALGFSPANCGDTKSNKIRYYKGMDATNAAGRTHLTRISTLSSEQQKEIWADLESLLI